jgi:hypothetical protein
MLLRRRSAALRPLLPQPFAPVGIDRIKQKFRALRLCWHGLDYLPKARCVAVEEAVQLAEAPSPCTCETRGAEGRLYDKSGWLPTACDRHAKGDDKVAFIGDTLRTDFDLDAWIHGHAHETYDRKVSGTRVITNAKGSGPWPPNPGSSSRSN